PKALGIRVTERSQRSRSGRREGRMAPITGNTFKYRLLAKLPQEDMRRFSLNLHPVSFPLRHVLYNVGAPLEYVYFIEQGLASILMNMSNGSTVEVGMIGTEGMVGCPLCSEG